MTNKYRKGILAILKSDKGLLLMRKVESLEEEWSFLSGGAEIGETHEETFFREVNEELGLTHEQIGTVINTNISRKFSWPKKLFEKTGIAGQEQTIFIANINSDVKFDLEKTGELAETKWLMYKDALEFIPAV